MSKQKIIFVVGPTAVGKSEIAVKLAARINAEIISCDSMQVYQKLDIVNAMPSSSLRARIRHHLLGVVAPSEEYDVSCYRSDAMSAMARMIKKKKTPLFVGGTGLYMSVIINGLFPEAGKDARIRASLERQAQRKGSDFLYRRLKKTDPQAAGKIHPHDTKRIIRALEVFQVTGKRISDLQKTRTGLSDEYDVRMFCLTMDREDLYRRIDRRVDRMFKAGIVRQVRKALASGLSMTASCAIGIREVKGYLDGRYDSAEAKRLTKLNSRRLAKRQLTWFRKDKRIEWVTIKEKEPARSAVQKIWKKLS